MIYKSKTSNYLAHLYRSYPIFSRKVSSFFGAVGRTFDKIAYRFTRVSTILSGKEEDYYGNVTAIVRRYLDYLRDHNEVAEIRPLFSIVMPVYKVKHEYLIEALESIESQIYDNWELCLVEDFSEDNKIHEILKTFAKKHTGKVKLLFNLENLNISQTSNRALDLCSGDYIGFVDHDDRLMPNALAEMVRYINYKSKPAILFSDEVTINENGEPINQGFYKPGWSPFFHMTVNYTNHFTCYRKDVVEGVGKFREGYEGAQDYDFMLRACEFAWESGSSIVHVPFLLYQWRAHSESTAIGLSAKNYAILAGQKAILAAGKRRGRLVQIEYNERTARYKVSYDLKFKDDPLVSIVIPSKNCYNNLKACVESVLNKSSYKNIEIIIVDNGSNQREVLNYYEQLVMKNNIKIVYFNKYFRFGKLCNKGVEEAAGDFIVFLNNDTEVISEGWIETLLGYAQFDEVGAVGCKLLYPDKTIQHAGVICVGSRVAEHIGRRYYHEDVSFDGIFQSVHDVTVVSAACMMIKKKVFLNVGQFDEMIVPNGFGDVEFCLRLLASGYTNVYTPDAALFHYESKSRGSAVENFEKFYITEQYPQYLVNDCSLNPNLKKNNTYSFDNHNFNFAWNNSLYREIVKEYLHEQ